MNSILIIQKTCKIMEEGQWTQLPTGLRWHLPNRPVAQIPQCTSPISHFQCQHSCGPLWYCSKKLNQMGVKCLHRIHLTYNQQHTTMGKAKLGSTHYWLLVMPISLMSWWHHQMETFSTLLALCAGNSPVTGEFPSQRSATCSFDAFFHLCLNKWLSKQS